ncbi:hypothetical protein ACFLU5_03695, partial [Bacteroidota bacterium]
RMNECGFGPTLTFTIEVGDIPPKPVPVVDTAYTCIEDAIPTLSVTGSYTLRWYSDSLETNPANAIGLGTAFTPNAGMLDMTVEDTTTFYIRQFDQSCTNLVISEYASVSVVVEDCPVDCSPFDVQAISVNTSCPEIGDGAVFVLVESGIKGPYEFSIDGVNFYGFTLFATTLDTLSEGDYTVDIRDIGVTPYCYISKAVTIASDVSMVSSIVQENPSCNQDDGKISIQISGGSTQVN